LIAKCGVSGYANERAVATTKIRGRKAGEDHAGFFSRNEAEWVIVKCGVSGYANERSVATTKVRGKKTSDRGEWINEDSSRTRKLRHRFRGAKDLGGVDQAD
jgi:hypothetical protein